jgi:hypothetical protein
LAEVVCGSIYKNSIEKFGKIPNAIFGIKE